MKNSFFKQIPIAILASMVLCVALVGCAESDASQADTAALDTTVESAVEEIAEVEAEMAIFETEDTILINGVAFEITQETEEYVWHDAQTMTAEKANTFEVGTFAGYQVYIDGQMAGVGETIEVSFAALTVDIGVEIKLVDETSGTEHFYYIRSLHEEYNAIAEGTGTGDGVYYFTQFGTLYKMDMSGNIIYYKEVFGVAGDFKQYTIDGEVYYTYFESVDFENGVAYSSDAQSTSRAIVMNADYEIIDIVESLSTEQGMAANTPLDSHDFYMIDVGHYIIASYVGVAVDNVPTNLIESGSTYITQLVLQEIKDGALLLQWCSTDYPEFYTYSVRKNVYNDEDEVPVDYVHFNSVDIDAKDGNLILSLRPVSGVVKIDRETGEVLWILGGDGDDFGLTDEEKFSRQHLAYYSDTNTITMFDNGNANGQTRAVEVTIDEETLEVIEYNAYQIDGVYASAMGSAIRLDDESALFLMGWGSRSDETVFTEINFDTNEILFELIDNDTDYWNGSYRVYKFDF